jgi:hypothetical protein
MASNGRRGTSRGRTGTCSLKQLKKNMAGGRVGGSVGGCKKRGGPGPSFLLTNIARLITQSGRSKASFLKDQAEANNCQFIGVTETWLNSSILDSEVSHDFPGYSLFRGDRSDGRQGGGVALYLREDLTGDVLATFSNSVCDLLVIKINQLDTVVCVAYRPPDTRQSEFGELLKCLETTLSSLPSPTPNIVLMGDFNFPRSVVVWHRSEEGQLVPLVADHGDEALPGGKQDRLQAQQLLDLASKHFLLPCREVEC